MDGIDSSQRVWEDRNAGQEDVLIWNGVDLHERPWACSSDLWIYFREEGCKMGLPMLVNFSI